MIDATKDLSPAQWNFKAAPDKWSIAEVTEHIAAAEDFLMGMVKEKVMTAPPRPAGDDVAAIDAMVTTAVPDRSHKAQAPEPLKPTNRFGSPDGSLKHFTESRDATETFLKNTNDLRGQPSTARWARNLMPTSGSSSLPDTASATRNRSWKSKQTRTFPKASTGRPGRGIFRAFLIRPTPTDVYFAFRVN